MISSVHYIELYIEKQLVELKSQDSLNLRLNNILFNPTKTATEQATYSYSFEIPSTPKNDKILDYANVLAKANKFHTRYHADVYADGTLIFQGSLTVKSYDGENKVYECNLVNIKINSLDEIFGDAVLTDVPWYVDYNGAETINAVNANRETKYFFPLVSYGAFIKDTLMIDEYGVEDYYSSKYLIDDTNKWFIDSFYPSLNMVEEMKKCFEWKGYKVAGDALFDPTLNNVYLSTNLASEQSPTFNVGNPKIGTLDLYISWSGSTNLSPYGEGNVNHMTQTLKFPYLGVGWGNYNSETQSIDEPKWNFDEVLINPLLQDGEVSVTSPSAMYVPKRGQIVVPADGFYKITLESSMYLTQENSIYANQYVCNWDSTFNRMSTLPTEEVIEIVPNLRVTMPFELQLVKNYDENLELIKGKNNIIVRDGHFDHDTEVNKGKTSNFYNYETCFPHEKAGIYPFLFTPNEGANALWEVWPTKRDVISDAQTLKNFKNEANIGYVQGNGEMMCYDPVVSDSFICGFTTMGNKNGGGTPAFVKNGYSWSKTYSERTDAMYQQNGYKKLYYDTAWVKHSDASTYNSNTLVNSPRVYHQQGNDFCNSRVYGIVHLKKGDKLEVMGARRMYWNDSTPLTYSVTVTSHLKIEAASPKNIYMLRANNYNWQSPTEFPTQLNLFNFTNKETKVSDWIQNACKAFNLSLTMDGNTVDINTNKGIKKTIDNAVDIDNRVNSYSLKSEYISYPKEMSVQFKIDTSEHGFYESVPIEHINDEDWKEYGDYGYTVIKLNDDTYETSTQTTQTNFSYTWYDTFSIANSSYSGNVTIPVLSLEEYMIDGYDYKESMQHRGYTLAQRFFFRTFERIDCELELEDDYTIGSSAITSNKVYVYAPRNQMDGFNLSYKDTEKSIVSEYFNIYPMLASNYVNIDTYLTPKEYTEIKGGAPIHVDSDIYYCSSIENFDPQGSNKTTLKLIKKV